MTKIVFGCGYLGLRVARRWLQGGDRVVVLTRTPERADVLAAEGFEPRVGDLGDPAFQVDLPEAHSVLFAVGFDRGGGHAMREVYVDGLRRALEHLAAPPDCFFYTSSTGVYGQGAGEWITEEDPCVPEREGGQLCLEAEAIVQAHPATARHAILRLAGLYGPGRIPRQQALRSGELLRTESRGFLNLIHVEDAVNVILQLECEQERHGSLLPLLVNVSDGHPVVRNDYFAELARLLDAPAPRFGPPDPIDPASRRARSSKRISNARLRQQVEANWLYPSYREGLAAIVAATPSAPGEQAEPSSG